LPWQQRSFKSKYKEREEKRKGHFTTGEREKEVIIIDASVAACTTE